MNQEEKALDEKDVFDEKLGTAPFISTSFKIIALILFIVLPLIGVWIGYMNSPAKIVEVEKIVVKETEPVNEITEVYQEETVQDEFGSDSDSDSIQTASENRVNIDGLYEFSLPHDWSEKYYNKTIRSIDFRTYSINYVYDSFTYRLILGDLDKSSYHILLMTSEKPSEFVKGLEQRLENQDLEENFRKYLIESLKEEKEKEQLKEETFEYLQSGEFPIYRFETNNYRFAGIARFDNYANCFDVDCPQVAGSNVRYRLYLVDRFYGDVIELSIKLEGEEFEEIRTFYADEFSEKDSDNDVFSKAFADLIESKSRDELSFGYLLDDTESLANSLRGINERDCDCEEKG